MSDHTPGPWGLGAREEGTIADHGGGGAVILRRDRNGMPCEGDMRLMAAAPDLLEALRFLVAETMRADNPCDEGLDSDCLAMVRARDAIRKATGP